MSNLFEKATRLAYRFPFGRGNASVEDLWNLPLTRQGNSIAGLDQIAVELHNQLTQTTTKSFLKDSSSNSAEVKLLEDKLEIVKHIIKVLETEKEVAASRKKRAAERAQERHLLLSALEQKRAETVLSLTEEELLNRLNETEEDSD